MGIYRDENMVILATDLRENSSCLSATSIHGNTPLLFGIRSKILGNKFPPEINVVILH
jgi:hypothetical protein